MGNHRAGLSLSDAVGRRWAGDGPGYGAEGRVCHVDDLCDLEGARSSRLGLEDGGGNWLDEGAGESFGNAVSGGRPGDGLGHREH